MAVKLMSRKEVAEMLGVSVDTVKRWGASRTELPFHVIGRRVKYRLADVEAYIESKRKEVVR